MIKDSKDSDKFNRETSTDSPALPNKADTPGPEPSSSHEGNDGLLDDEKTWPSVVDLNTRLRRVISSYQRSVKKEDVKVLQKTKSGMENDTTVNHATSMNEPPLNMQGWDLQQLAMYLLVSYYIQNTSCKKQKCYLEHINSFILHRKWKEEKRWKL